MHLSTLESCKENLTLKHFEVGEGDDVVSAHVYHSYYLS